MILVTTFLLTYIGAHLNGLHADLTHRRQHLRDDHRDRGSYTVESVVVTALVIIIAVGALAVITTKVMAKANSIDLDATG